MKKTIGKTIGYIFLRYFLFYIALYLVDRNVKSIKSTDLQTKQDWFMFSWLFLLPVLVEVIVLSIPFSYGLTKIEGKDQGFFYLLFTGLFVVEFLLYDYILGIKYPFIKVSISILLFLLLFKKRLL